MSKVIPMDEPLSDESRKYLRSTGAVGQAREAQLDQMFPPDPEALAAFNAAEVNHFRALHDTTGATGELTAALEREQALLARIAELEAAANPPAATTDYSTWLKAELEAEIDRVNAEDEQIKAGTTPPLAKGKQAEMAATLAAYFAE